MYYREYIHISFHPTHGRLAEIQEYLALMETDTLKNHSSALGTELFNSFSSHQCPTYHNTMVLTQLFSFLLLILLLLPMNHFTLFGFPKRMLMSDYFQQSHEPCFLMASSFVTF
jgi:hypothetical protein